MDTITRPNLTLTRRLKAPVERVFRAWTEGEALMRWFGPGGNMRMVSAEVDLKVGGQYSIRMANAEGEQHHVLGAYREIAPNRRLVFTWAWGSTPERESLVTVTLKPADGGTELTLTHEQFFDADARDRHQHGWTATLDRLVAHLS